MKTLNNSLKNLFLLFISIVVSLLILEFFLRFFSPINPFCALVPLRPHLKNEMRVNLQGVSKVGMHSTNKWGMRGDEPPLEWDKYYTIITLGGSSTQCFYLDDHKTWPYLLQEKLKLRYPKIWVGNAGLDGQTSRSHLIFMENIASRIKPRTVIVLCGVNDLGLSLSQDARLFGSDFDKTGLKYKIFANSRLIQILYNWKLIIFNKATVVKTVGHGNYSPQVLQGQEIALPNDLKLFLPSLEEYRQNIKKMIERSKSLNIRMIFLTQPLLYDNTDYWKDKEGNFYWINKTKNKLSAANYWKMLNIFNQELLKICSDEKIECFDLASQIPHSSLYFYDTCHFNEKGAELVAEKIAEYFKI
ncbi:MAG: SGNH/GDSL hydrolase family protein [Candidatus Omnitrophica bacterium]|nr:SGNH/GDSL hydrolase family protein [Candidatus Omnitrophota bacterium]